MNERKRLAMTVDVEEWFTGVADEPVEIARYPSRLDVGMNRLLEVLAESNTRATFFFLGYIAKLAPHWVAKVAGEGHEIGSHGYYHRPVWSTTPAEFRTDQAEARRVILAAGAPEVVGFRAPLFSLQKSTTWAFPILEELGFRYSSSLFPIRNPRYGYPGGPVRPLSVTATGRFTEFPLSTLDVAGMRLPFCGGFYLRALPSAVLKHAFGQVLKQDGTAVCYIHPWELDPDQPDLANGPANRLRHRIGLRTTASKLKTLLRSFSFATMGEVLADSAPTQRSRHLPLL